MRGIKGHPLPLGITEYNGIVNFSLEVKSGKTCRLCIYKKEEELPELTIELPEQNAVGEVRFIALPISQVKGREYNYEIDGVKKLDSYVKVYTTNAHTGEMRGKILQDAYDWEGDRPLCIPNHEVIAYSLHVRGFTMHRSSQVKHKGTFRGLVEKLPYFRELGINQIQCMPVYDFDENTSYTNYWGYGEANCFAMKKRYAASKNAEKEFKDTVKTFHQNGIEIVLNMPFTEQTPKQRIVDCLRYYRMEYHVDGFVLNPYVAPMDSIRTDAILMGTKILVNHDDYQNTIRRFLRGDKGILESVMQNMRKISEQCGGYNYITNHTGFTLVDMVSYNRKHNEANGENNCDGPSVNYSWNCGREGNTRNEEIISVRRQQRRNAMALLLLSQGTPVILAGDEFGNSQKGNNNVYCQDNDIAWLNWNGLQKDREFFEYVKKLIAIRKQYPVFGSKLILTGTDKHGCGVPDISYHGENAWKIDETQKEPYLGIYYHVEDGTDCFVAYNMQECEQEIALPSLGKKKVWYRSFTTEEGQLHAEKMAGKLLEDNQRKIMVPARTIVLLIGR
ncbi:MAG: glycogen debranching protein [Tyzzerella sp.]|nr:glycogen debranching protein [Tyzzerella sp.]